MQRVSTGYYSVLIVQPEQLTLLHQGHRTRLSRLIEDNRSFVNLIQGLCIDEAHFMFTAGRDLYETTAFRPAWGDLGCARIRIGKRVPAMALSGTLPPHIKAHIINKLIMNERTLISIELSSNRFNILLATHAIVGSCSNLNNLDFLVPLGLKGPFPRTIIFHDNSDEAQVTAMHINSRLAPELQQKGIATHYYGAMSKGYLTDVFDDFADPNGTCRFLHATAGASTVGLIEHLELLIRIDMHSRALISAGSSVWCSMALLGTFLIRSSAVEDVDAVQQSLQSS